MDPQQQQLLPAVSAGCTRFKACVRRFGVAAGMTLVLLTGMSGCVPNSFLVDMGPSCAPPCVIATRWEHEVRLVPDTEHNGKPMPHIVGRVTLFASDLTTPVVAKGIISVYLYNDMPGVSSKEEEPLEYWALKADIVQRLLKRDAAGWGYTLVLPWTTYQPELTKVRVKVRFDRADTKDILYSTPIPITFEKPSDKPKMTFTSKQIRANPAMCPAISLAGQAPQPPVQDVGGGSLPTTVTLSPPPPKNSASLGNDIPFVVPPPGTVPARQ